MSSLLDASEFVRILQNRQGVVASAREEIAYYRGWITKEDLVAVADRYGKSEYGQHLRAVAEGKIRG